MQSNYRTELERIRTLEVAAGFDDQSKDILIANLFEILEYRSKVAENLLRCKNMDSEEYKTLESIYERSQYHIKMLLGLE